MKAEDEKLISDLREWLAEFGDASYGRGHRVVRMFREATDRLEEILTDDSSKG